MLIPAWHIAFLWLLYALAYLWRFLKHDRRKRYITLGMAIDRLVLAGTYFYIALFSLSPAQSQILVRWSLMLFLLVELIFIVLEYIIAYPTPTNEHKA